MMVESGMVNSWWMLAANQFTNGIPQRLPLLQVLAILYSMCCVSEFLLVLLFWLMCGEQLYQFGR